MKLHVVSFQVPYPPIYGGLIDVFYKLKALKEEGCRIVLHTYQYRTRQAEALEEVADEVYYYKRQMGVRSFCSPLPYIVYSRRDPLLLERLCEDESPILFEGLYTCYFLDHPRLRHRLKIVRAHNIEHDYYRHLATATHSFVRWGYYRMEACKLRWYEKQLRHADALLAITPADESYFSRKYAPLPVCSLPCFYNNRSSEETPGTAPYLLYHGNLSVEENVRAVRYILDELFPLLRADIRLIIAGKSPGETLKKRIVKEPRIRLIADPSEEEMHRLIVRARINLMLTFQDTGIKLKLIHSLFKGQGYCLVNSPMLTDETLAPFLCNCR